MNNYYSFLMQIIFLFSEVGASVTSFGIGVNEKKFEKFKEFW